MNIYVYVHVYIYSYVYACSDICIYICTYVYMYLELIVYVCYVYKNEFSNVYGHDTYMLHVCIQISFLCVYILF